MAAPTSIICARNEHVSYIRFNRPDHLNAWNRAMEAEVREAMVAASADPATRVIVLTGVGKGFCAGADLAADKDEGEVRVPPFVPRRFSYFQQIEKPVVAAINGPAVGIGFVIALLSDIRLASDRAKIGAIFPRRGLVAEHGTAWLLPRLVGMARASDLLLTGRLVEATEALQMGLVSKVFPLADFAEEVHAFCADLANSCSPLAVSTIKRQIRMGLDRDFASSIDDADLLLEKCKRTSDYREGISHFVEKRPPRFTGN